MSNNFTFLQNKKINFLKQYLPSILILLFITVFIRILGIAEINSRYLGGSQGDSGLYIWLFKHSIKEMFEYGWFNTGSFFPYSKDIAWSDNFFIPALLGYLSNLLNLSTIFTYNLTLLLCTFLNGFCTFLLATKLSGRSWLSLTSGILFLTYSFFTLNLGHPQVQFAFWLPLSAFCFFNFLSSKKKLWCVLIGLCLSGAFLTAVYYAVFSALLLASIFVFFSLLHPQYLKRQDYFSLSLYSIFGLCPLIPFIEPYLAVQSTFGSRYLFEPYGFAISTLNYLNYSEQILNIKNIFEKHYEFVGMGIFPIIISLLTIFRFKIFPNKKIFFITILSIFLTISLAILIPFIKNQSSLLFEYRTFIRFSLGISSWLSLLFLSIFIFKFGKLERKYKCNFLSNRGIILIFLSVAYFFFILTLGPLGDISINKNETPIGVFTLFFYIFPALKSIRDISRLATVVTLAISIILPFALMSFSKPKSYLRFITPLALSCIIIFENFIPNYPFEILPATPKSFLKLKDLHAKNRDAVTLILPMTSFLNKHGGIKSWRDYAIKNVNYMNWASDENIKVVNGYSGMVTKIMREFPRKTENFPDDRSITTFSTISGLEYILFNSQEIESFNKNDFEKKLDQYKELITRIYSDNSGWQIFKLKKDNLITKNFNLQVPSYPKGYLELELRTPDQCQNSITTVELFAKLRFEENPFQTLNLPCDNNWHKFKVDLPETIDTVRPLFLKFKEKNGIKLYLGKNYYKRS